MGRRLTEQERRQRVIEQDDELRLAFDHNVERLFEELIKVAGKLSVTVDELLETLYEKNIGWPDDILSAGMEELEEEASGE